MKRRVVIIGAGGHGREVLDAIRALNAARTDRRGTQERDGDDPQFEVVGFVADSWPNVDEIERLGFQILGGLEVVENLPAGFIVAIGDGAVRREMDAECSTKGCEAVTVVHPRAMIGTDAVIGVGCYVGPGACVMTNARLGRHVHLNVNAVVSHDAVVGDFTTLSPGVMINGAAQIGEEVFFGTGAIVLPGRVVGDGAVIGAGAVVVSDVPPGVTAVGVPARWRAT